MILGGRLLAAIPLLVVSLSHCSPITSVRSGSWRPLVPDEICVQQKGGFQMRTVDQVDSNTQDARHRVLTCNRLRRCWKSSVSVSRTACPPPSMQQMQRWRTASWTSYLLARCAVWVCGCGGGGGGLYVHGVVGACACVHVCGCVFKACCFQRSAQQFECAVDCPGCSCNLSADADVMWTPVPGTSIGTYFVVIYNHL